MLHVMAVIRVHADHLSRVTEAMRVLAVASRAEPGCLRYEVFQRAGEPVLVTQESWSDAAAESAHLAGPNVARAFAAADGLLAAAPEIHRYSECA